MARPSPAALDVMEHIAEAMDVLSTLMASIEHLEDWDVVREIARARDELERAKATGAEVLLELLNLSERHELMQDQIAQIRARRH
jgi:predicted  nucleic acid-binding Zn-ribbon protein